MSQEKEPLGDLPDFSLLILCGGKAKRLGRRNKPLLPVRVNGHNKPMIDHIIDACEGALDIIISANTETDAYELRGRVVSDPPSKSGPQGPLVGILEGLKSCATHHLLVVPGDTPCLEKNWHQRLLRKAAQIEESVLVAHDNHRRQNLHCLLPLDVAPSLETFILKGNHSARVWLEEVGAIDVLYPRTEMFLNVNDQTDLDQLL
jgi:molybdopterin-guanine dinucleotide biosynthesis protein A